MNYEVPQFIREEIKLAGIITFTQLGFIVGAFFIIFILYFLLVSWLWLLLSIIIAISVFALAFGSIEGVAFYKLIGAILVHFWSPRTYTWKRKIIKKEKISSETLPVTSDKKTVFFSSVSLPAKTLKTKNLSEIIKILDKKNNYGSS